MLKRRVHESICSPRQGCHRGSGIKGRRYRRGCQINRYSDRRYHCQSKHALRLYTTNRKISTPYTYMAYVAKNKGDEDKVSSALAKTDGGRSRHLEAVNDKENRQTATYTASAISSWIVVVSKLFRHVIKWRSSSAKPKMCVPRDTSARK